MCGWKDKKIVLLVRSLALSTFNVDLEFTTRLAADATLEGERTLKDAIHHRMGDEAGSGTIQRTIRRQNDKAACESFSSCMRGGTIVIATRKFYVLLSIIVGCLDFSYIRYERY